MSEPVTITTTLRIGVRAITQAVTVRMDPPVSPEAVVALVRALRHERDRAPLPVVVFTP